jgi:hypothetical protein
MTPQQIELFVNNKVTCNEGNIKIVDSCFVQKRDFTPVLKQIKVKYPNSDVLTNRCWWHMRMEWATHNCLYMLGLWESHTKDVDINYPLPLWEKVVYAVLGPLCWLVIN